MRTTSVAAWGTGGEVVESAWHGGDQGLRAAGWGLAERWVNERCALISNPVATSKTDRAGANAKIADSNGYTHCLTGPGFVKSSPQCLRS